MRKIDTSYNYHGFRAHEILSKRAGDLLGDFDISTKVGFFRTSNGFEHSLSPSRLRQAVEEAVEQLGIPPAVIFLHNPEHTLTGLNPAYGQALLAAACTSLEEAASDGLCQSWGIASWNPIPLLRLFTDRYNSTLPAPKILMLRSGLTVNAATLAAGEALTQNFALTPEARWGMSPFGGSSTDPIWHQIDTRIFLPPSERDCSYLQAAFRVSFHLPNVSRVAVGTDRTDHLHELLAATERSVNAAAVTRYRHLLSKRKTRNLSQ
ncbi:aldo-keto reductase family protein [Salinactinospora qingdaonensis]|uniref:aldo/keto reductase n=1 Tax=Salinactinospora qingdaonensis TaxID=702744 RepID=UPI0031E5657A